MTGKNIHKETFFNRHRDILVCLFLVLTTLAVYWQVGNHEFVNIDDNLYVTENLHVQAGPTLESITWAFSTTRAGNWHPLTWLSHMLDCQLCGLNPGWHHLTNLLFHIASTLLLFLVLRRMTGGLWQSAFVAVLFALHPLHVESVAWVSERKDVLSTFFWMLTMWVYLLYVKHPGLNRYLLVLLAFVLGLMSKPMLVTLPFVLLLMDYWPLCRFQSKQLVVDDNAQKRNHVKSDYKKSTPLSLILEKVPLIVVSAIFSIVTLWAQHSVKAVQSFEALSLKIRIANALVSYVSYIGKMIWPYQLAVFYPHPLTLSMWHAVAAFLLLVFVSVLVIRFRQKYPYLIVGWLWYLGTLIPVIGVVQVGFQTMADRYTYVPLIGLFIMIAWVVPDILAGWRYRRVALAASAGFLITVFMVCTWLQAGYWRKSITLFEHALAVTENNWLAHNNLGFAISQQGKIDEAIAHYLEALRIKTDYLEARYNMGFALSRQGKIDDAIACYQEALRIKPDYVKARYNLGIALFVQGKIDEAIAHYQEALRVKPDFVEAYYNLGIALFVKGEIDEAISHYQKALRIKPDFAEAHCNLGIALDRQGKTGKAISHYVKALRIRPDYTRARYILGVALMRQGKMNEAAAHFREILRIKPGIAEAHNGLGVALMRQGKIKEAATHFREALRIKPDYVQAYKNLQLALNMKKESR